MPDSPAAMTVRQVAQSLNVNEKTVYRLVQRGELPGFKVAGAWRFQRDDMDGWIAARKREVQETRGSESARSKVSVERQVRDAHGGRAAR